MGEAGIRGGGLGWVGVGEVYFDGPILPHSPHTPSVNRGSHLLPTCCLPGPTPCRPLSTPCVPVTHAGTQSPRPLGTTGCPEPRWTQQGAAGHSRPPGPTPRVRLGPPGGGAGRPQGTRNPFTFLDQNSHPAPPQPTLRPPQPTLRPPLVHPYPPTTHTWLIEVPKSCAKVSIG